jgi:DNA-binding NarL/FixJ family response regulator
MCVSSPRVANERRNRDLGSDAGAVNPGGEEASLVYAGRSLNGAPIAAFRQPSRTARFDERLRAGHQSAKRRRISVGVCEEHEILRAGLLALLAKDPVLDVTAMVPEQITEHQVDVAIVSSKASCGASFQCPIVIVSDDNEAPMSALVGNDVAGVLHRDSLTVSRLLASVHAAAVGLRLQAPFGNGSDATLDPRAVRVLELIAEGYSTREIATSMNYSERTIKKLINELGDRLQARTRAQTVAHAMRRGLI